MMSNFHENLIALRVHWNYSLEELGEKVGISASSLSKLCRAQENPSMDTVCRIAKFFGVSLDVLLNFEVDPTVITYGGIRFNHLTKKYTVVFAGDGTKGRGRKINHNYDTLEAAVSAIKRSQHRGYAKCARDVCARSIKDDVRSGPRLSGPADRDLGIELSRNESPLRGEEEALP
jgi:transcriptional regulator with XRE-family HTH domain